MTNQIKKQIRNMLKNIRTTNDLTQKQLAKLLNVKPAIISHYENGRAIPPLDILAIYRSKLNLDINTLTDKEIT